MMLLALAACGRAEAVPPGGPQLPAGWEPLADLATAARDAAKGEGITVERAQAWGETAMGCYAVSLSLRGVSATPADLAKDLATALPAFAVKNPIVGGDSVSITFERAPYSGVLRARVVDLGVDADACFSNDREPSACAKSCAGVMAQ